MSHSADWINRSVLVTGGASFIGSHLVDALVERGAKVRVVDDLSTGRSENIAHHLKSGQVELMEEDLLEPGTARRAMDGIQVVFHLAAKHGGRGYVDRKQAASASNLALDGLVFKEALRARVEKVVFASSGCVYPSFLQGDPAQELYLSESDVGPPYDADNLYGWAKLLGELTLRSYYQEHGLPSVSCRFFTVYGSRGREDHAVMAMIARAFVEQDPFEVWGDGNQVRNWTHVEDIVRGTLAAAERIHDGSAVNLGTQERIRVIEAVEEVLRHTGHRARIQFRSDMPIGPPNRVSDNSLARRLLDWQPQVPFVEGLHRTIDWYYTHRERSKIRETLGQLLI